ncbi:MAG: hypothetical protein Q9162_002090 [Coniocarpon cinnabarinum]
MVVPAIDTPRTDFAASVTNHAHQLADFTQSSIPSPSKDRNDLVKGLRGRRAFEPRSPQSRPPFGELRNFPNGKPEFTPLLKSATRNRSVFAGKENLGINGHKPATPAGFRESYRSDLPDLPEHSSVLYEDDTGSEQERGATPRVPQSSSSVLATPIPALERNGRGGLGEAQYGNLREQEARVEQLDKDNFGLRLKIHYLEEAQKRGGKEFNEILVKQLTDLQIDKLTLQKDLRHYRKQYNQSQKDLENKSRSNDESVNEEIDKLQQTLAEKEDELKAIQDSNDSSEDLRKEIEKLRDDNGDLEHELRQKDQELDEKDDYIDELKASTAHNEEIKELQKQLEEREEDVKGLQDALRTEASEHDRKLREKDRALELKDDEVRDLEEELKSAGREESFAAKGRELSDQQLEIDRVREQLESSAAKAKTDIAHLRAQLELAEKKIDFESRERQREVEERDEEIQRLEQKVSTSQNRHEDLENLRDQISDLENEVRQRERKIEEREDLVDELNGKIKQIENDSDEELMSAQDRIQELELEKQRNLKDLQGLRDAESNGEAERSQALLTAQSQIHELESSAKHAGDAEKQLQREMHRLRDDIKRLEKELDERESDMQDRNKAWDSQRDVLESACTRAEEKAKSLENAISKLRESEGTLSGKEMALQKLLEDEKDQHVSAQVSFQKQLEEANSERAQLKESLRQLRDRLREAETGKNENSEEAKALQDKIQSLEDEIEVLQSSHEKDATRSSDDLAAAHSETESLRRQLTGVKNDLARAQADHSSAESRLANLQQPRRSPSPQTTPRATRQMRERLQQLESDRQAAAKLRAELEQVNTERQALQKRLEEAEARRRASPDDAATLVDQSSPSRSSSCRQSGDSGISSLRSQLSNLQEEKGQLEDDLDLLSSDFESALSDRNAALGTVRDLRKQLSDAARAADHKYHSQVAEYERDIANLEDELSSSRAGQREQEIKAESTNATVARLRKRLEGAENDLATSRARERTSSESPEAGRRERRELQDAIRRAERKVDDLQSQIADKDAEIESTRVRHSDLQSQLQNLQRDRRNAASRADNLSNELAQLRASSIDDAQLQKLRSRHASELRGLAKQIQYLSAKCTRSERLRQDAAFAKSYVGKVVEVYARVHRMDLRLVREMGISVPLDDAEPLQQPRKLGGGVDATPRSVKKRRDVEEEPILRRREKRPTLRQVGLVMRAAVRVKKRMLEWRVVQKEHEGVLKKWRSLRDERKMRKVG